MILLPEIAIENVTSPDIQYMHMYILSSFFKIYKLHFTWNKFAYLT
jgi:hypothetical protein